MLIINNKNNYSNLFLGSSIFHGHLKGYSFVDMLKEDYVKIKEKNKISYLLKDENLSYSGKFSHEIVYCCDDKILSVNATSLKGSYMGSEIELVRRNGYYYIKKDDKTIANIAFFDGDNNVYKLTANGASMAYFTPKELLPYGREYEQRSYFNRLRTQTENIEKLDNFFLQLSTNDAMWASKNDVELGEITPFSKMKTSDFDYKTSLGAMEYMIAFAREKWNCNITVIICPYISTEGDYGRNYLKLVNEMGKLKEKWNISILDLYHDDEIYKNVTSKDKEWLNRFMYEDRVHFTSVGYKLWIYPKIREFIDNI